MTGGRTRSCRALAIGILATLAATNGTLGAQEPASNEQAVEQIPTGDETIAIEFRRSDGSLVTSGKLMLAVWREGFQDPITVFEGSVPPSGLLQLENMPDSNKFRYGVALEELHNSWLPAKPDEGNVYRISLAPRVGEHAPNIKLSSLAQPGTSIELESLKGKVVVLDFWTTWCGPCEAPMSANNALVKKRIDWEGKVVFLGANLDKLRSQALERVEEREWWAVHQTWSEEGGGGFNSLAARKYAVAHVPHSFLIDQEGIIRAVGHPTALGIEEQVDRLLADCPNGA